MGAGREAGAGGTAGTGPGGVKGGRGWHVGRRIRNKPRASTAPPVRCAVRVAPPNSLTPFGTSAPVAVSLPSHCLLLLVAVFLLLLTCRTPAAPNSVQVIAVAERGALFDPGPCMYMEKLAVGPQVRCTAHHVRQYTAACVCCIAPLGVCCCLRSPARARRCGRSLASPPPAPPYHTCSPVAVH